MKSVYYKKIFALIMTLALVGMAGGGCGDDDGTAADADGIDGAATDGAVPTDAVPDGGPCEHLGPLGESCEDDCDCQTDFRCRGLPGERACAVDCLANDACQGALPGCENNAVCDLNLGACRCMCQGGDCPTGEQCHAGYCVGCATDDHCASEVCTDPTQDHGVCRLDTETCSCGGTCGDGVCDEAEQGASTCPADCPGPCVDGEVLPYACADTTLVAWCTCVAGQWDCVDAVPSCPEPNACRRQGGSCIADPVECYEGTVSADASGCEGTTPLCCLPNDCTRPGLTYDPFGFGICCPGLRPLDALMIMESWDPETPGMQCCSTCFVKTCAPCGDGVCQLHLGETTCNCPEDCPVPPFPLVCSEQMTEACGQNYCRQEGTSCHQSIPSCVANVCEYDVQDLPGQVCDPTQGICVTP